MTAMLVNPYDLLCIDTTQAARVGLLALMAGISEEFWNAGWMNGMEFSLWQVKAGTRFGQDNITERQATLLRLLAEEAGGWWVWDGGPKFLTADEWAARRAATSKS